MARTGANQKEVDAILQIAESLDAAMDRLHMPPAAKMSAATSLLMSALHQQAMGDGDDFVMAMTNIAHIQSKCEALARATSRDDFTHILQMIADRPGADH